MEQKDFKNNMQNFPPLLCTSHDLNCMNICLFSNCPDPFLCSKCISKHNPLHINKILSYQDFLYDKNEGILTTSENIIKELAFSINNFQNQFKEKYKNVQNEIKNIFLTIKDSFHKLFDSYQQKCLNYANQNFERITSSLQKLQEQLDQNQIILSQFTSQNQNPLPSQSNLHQKFKNMINLNTTSLPALKDSIQKSMNEFYTLSVKIHSKEFLENFDLHLKQIFLDHESLILFSQNRKTRVSTLGNNMQRKSSKMYRSMTMSPERQSADISQNYESENVNPYHELSIDFEVCKKIELGTPVNAVYYHKDSSDKKYLFVGCNNCLIKMYEFTTGKLLLDMKGHEGAVKSFAYIDDIKTLISASLDNTMKLWDLSNASNIQSIICMKTIPAHSDYIRVLLYIEEMRILVSAGEDKIVKIWDVLNMQCIGNLMGHKKGIYCLVYFNKFLISGSSDYTFKIWKISSKECVRSIIANQGTINSLCVLDKSDLLAVGGSDKSIKIWEAKTWKVKSILVGHLNYICSMICINDEKNMVSASADHTIKIWDLVKEVCLKTYSQHENWVLVLLSIPNLRCFVSGSSDKKMIIWRKYDENNMLDSNFG